jgi:integrase/recombinase XerC
MAAPSTQLSTRLFDDYVSFVDRTEKTTQAYSKNLRQFAAWLSYSQVSQPQRSDIIAFRDWLMSEHEAIRWNEQEGWEYRLDTHGHIVMVTCKPSTVKSYMQSVKGFFRWTASSGIYPNVADNIHTPALTRTHKKDSLSAFEVLEIEQTIKETGQEKKEHAALEAKDMTGRVQRADEQAKRMYAMYLLAVNAGLRTIELSRANVRDVQAKADKAWIYIYGKGHSEADQKKPIAKEVYEAIQDYLRSRKDKPSGNSPLFVATGNRSHGQRLSSTTISTMLKKVMQSAGYDSERLTAHSLRHTTGQMVMELTGNNIYATQMYMRHESPVTTEIYLNHEHDEQDAQIAGRLYKAVHGQDTEQNAKAQLHELIESMSEKQLEQLKTIALAMNGQA